MKEQVVRRTLELGLQPGGPELFKSDFDLAFYDSETISADVIEHHVSSFFGEKLMKPRVEPLWVGRNGELDPNYIAMMERSIQYWREKGDERAVERFSKELEGAKNTTSLIIESSRDSKEPQPIILNASDPGNFYVDQEGRKKSVTFVWVKQSSEESGWKYLVYSLPTKHLGLEEHWGIVKDLADIHKTEEILKQSLREEDLSANALIAFPLLLNSLIHDLDDVAEKMGYSNWDEIERISADQLALENDASAKERREKLVTDFSMRIFFAVKDQRPLEYQEALVAAMSDTLALEAGGEYLGLSAKHIEEEIEKNVQLALALRHKIFELESYADVQQLSQDLDIRFGNLDQLYLHYQHITQSFHNNPIALAARATGCGGSGNLYGQEFGMKISDFGGISIVQQGVGNLMADEALYKSSLSEPDIASDTEPEGRYLDKGATYKPGHCRACDTDRMKVWHKEDGGCDCCTTCEHRLAGGD